MTMIDSRPHIRLGLACGLMAAYLVPGTLFGQLSPVQWFVVTRTGTANRGALIALALCVVLPLLAMLVIGWSSKLWQMRAGLIAYLAVATVSICSQATSLGAANDACSVIVAAAAGILVAGLAPSIRSAIGGLSGLVLIQTAISLYQHHTELVNALPRAGGTYADSFILGTVTAACLPLYLVMGFRSKGAIEAALWSLGSALAFGACILTWNLTSFVALGAAAVYFLSRSLDRRTALLVSLAIFAAIGVYGSGIVKGTPKPSEYVKSLSARADQFQKTLSASGMLWGSGIGSSDTVVAGTFNDPASVAKKKVQVQRGVPLLWLIEQGIPGGILYATLLFAIVTFARIARTTEQIAVASSLICFGVSSLVATPFGAVANLTGTALFACLASLALRSGTESAGNGPGADLEPAPASG